MTRAEGSALRAAACIIVAACGEPQLATTEQELVDPYAFVLPVLSAPQRAQIIDDYAHLDPTNKVPRALLEDAIVYFDVNRSIIPKTGYFVVVDFSRYSGNNRFWLVDLTTGAVEPHKVAHGDGSDPDNDGWATLFSNDNGSHMSSLGFYLTGEIYDGTHPHSMRLDGLSPDGSPNGMANTNVRERLIVVHEADYVDDSNTSQQGRSNGCLALDPSIEVGVVDRIHDGSLIYAARSPLNPVVGPGACGDASCDGRENSFTCAEDCGVCGTIAETGVIDDGDTCFAASGPAARLHPVKAGANDSLIWTSTTALAGEQNFADWSLNFEKAGRYRVEVYTAAAYARSTRARYVVHSATAESEVTIDQTASDGYQTLGEFDFAQGAHQFVHLADNTGEQSAQLVFDALRLTRVGDGGAADDPGDDPGHDGGCSTSDGASLLIVFAFVGVRRRRLHDRARSCARAR